MGTNRARYGDKITSQMGRHSWIGSHLKTGHLFFSRCQQYNLFWQLIEKEKSILENNYGLKSRFHRVLNECLVVQHPQVPKVLKSGVMSTRYQPTV